MLKMLCSMPHGDNQPILIRNPTLILHMHSVVYRSHEAVIAALGL